MTRTWWDNEEILQQFRAWLTQTDEEIQSSDAAEDSPLAEQSAERAEPLPETGLLSLVEAFTAMRHELKLQTKSSRGLQESVQSALRGLDSAIQQFQSAQSREKEAADRAARPLVETLIGLDEALARGEMAIQATHRQVTRTAPQQLRESLDEQFHQLPAWRRWLVRPWHEQVQRACAEQFVRADEENFVHLMEGYQLIQKRLQRMLSEHQIRRIASVGQPVDPQRMTVVELVDDPETAPETVVDEVRPGYTWRGQVIRFAEVRAARSRSSHEYREQGVPGTLTSWHDNNNNNH